MATAATAATAATHHGTGLHQGPIVQAAGSQGRADPNDQAAAATYDLPDATGDGRRLEGAFVQSTLDISFVRSFVRSFIRSFVFSFLSFFVSRIVRYID